ncbi:hypothetical protein [Metamycoplasma hyosynoviae]|uniref:hypothetical protein n=1 Tax=Metamycoplasma hyosynoviae TaxID=29559 RepID=UPI0023599783|nr:hypothetical protein [Metamycoplasma hyosynoviae]MDC8914565.1 hypothetical protein [Metamycoplasma hyosynoviae]MDD1371990.1 hypothetical protein [Metamycoplasma hyosynoviae]MDD1373622.1 hypothetical protein [Metamycoplasma hyosynoviae]MDD1375617.1 hypothetical protein [Metamycoplasma hyosynoviae]MDD1376286.1 hypothetical protein [Metamycoplasma hyosynoviae]
MKTENVKKIYEIELVNSKEILVPSKDNKSLEWKKQNNSFIIKKLKFQCEESMSFFALIHLTLSVFGRSRFTYGDVKVLCEETNFMQIFPNKKLAEDCPLESPYIDSSVSMSHYLDVISTNPKYKMYVSFQDDEQTEKFSKNVYEVKATIKGKKSDLEEHMFIFKSIETELNQEIVSEYTKIPHLNLKLHELKKQINYLNKTKEEDKTNFLSRMEDDINAIVICLYNDEYNSDYLNVRPWIDFYEIPWRPGEAPKKRKKNMMKINYSDLMDSGEYKFKIPGSSDDEEVMGFDEDSSEIGNVFSYIKSMVKEMYDMAKLSGISDDKMEEYFIKSLEQFTEAHGEDNLFNNSAFLEAMLKELHEQLGQNKKSNQSQQEISEKKKVASKNTKNSAKNNKSSTTSSDSADDESEDTVN